MQGLGGPHRQRSCSHHLQCRVDDAHVEVLCRHHVIGARVHLQQVARRVCSDVMLCTLTKQTGMVCCAVTCQKINNPRGCNQPPPVHCLACTRAESLKRRAWSAAGSWAGYSEHSTCSHTLQECTPGGRRAGRRQGRAQERPCSVCWASAGAWQPAAPASVCLVRAPSPLVHAESAAWCWGEGQLLGVSACSMTAAAKHAAPCPTCSR